MFRGQNFQGKEPPPSLYSQGRICQLKKLKGIKKQKKNNNNIQGPRELNIVPCSNNDFL